MASTVERPATKPDCSGRPDMSMRGCMRSSSTFAKSLPGMESSVIGRIPHPDSVPLPLMTMMMITNRLDVA